MAVAAGGSSNGRTPGSGPGNGGSSPPPPAIFGFPASRLSQRRVQHGSRAAPSSRGLGHGPLKAETRVRIPLGPPTPVHSVRHHVAGRGGDAGNDRRDREAGPADPLPLRVHVRTSKFREETQRRAAAILHELGLEAPAGQATAVFTTANEFELTPEDEVEMPRPLQSIAFFLIGRDGLIRWSLAQIRGLSLSPARGAGFPSVTF